MPCKQVTLVVTVNPLLHVLQVFQCSLCCLCLQESHALLMCISLKASKRQAQGAECSMQLHMHTCNSTFDRL